MDRNSLQHQAARMRKSLFDQGYLEEQFIQLEDLQDDANPNFVEEIVTLFYSDSARLIRKIEQALSDNPLDFGKLDDYMHQFKGSSSSIGAKKVTRECTQFMEYCKAGNADGYSSLVKENLFPSEILHFLGKYLMEDKKLELRLGPPGEDNALLSIGYSCSNNNNSTCGTKRGLVSTFEAKTGERNWLINKNSTVTANSAVPNSSEKRIAIAPVVGWPPIRSSRKNLATSSSSKAVSESPNEVSKDASNGKSENHGNGLFVKINMDGVPIGRKVDLRAYDNYEELSSAVDELFRGLLAAQRDFSAALNEKEIKETKAITGLLDGNGEYTLVYEDNEGDRMLVGDVPWHMFLSTAKRLRVLKRSELSSLQVNSIKLEKKLPSPAVEVGGQVN
ncbi:hypothetical protein F0562_012522 [Nyssa sinensis]|uniref:Auxin-responsive protein n=1 Tax=Nyssa sinensis TaxID=561372 RepID=A0A5J4ZVR0_9ASTE|nr:hypothetical protein F0562_012522 [Nyssa sinensis]